MTPLLTHQTERGAVQVLKNRLVTKRLFHVIRALRKFVGQPQFRPPPTGTAPCVIWTQWRDFLAAENIENNFQEQGSYVWSSAEAYAAEWYCRHGKEWGKIKNTNENTAKLNAYSILFDSFEFPFSQLCF